MLNAGKVPDVYLLIDCNLRQSEGVGYIKFFDDMLEKNLV